MTEDKVILDGVEYMFGNVTLVVRSKREQTGWICRKCSCVDPCVYFIGATYLTGEADSFLYDMKCNPDWQPFYGKVVE